MRITPHVLTVLVSRAEDLPGIWVSHCLNLDVISQGETIPEAIEAIKEAVLMVLNEDESEGYLVLAAVVFHQVIGDIQRGIVMDAGGIADLQNDMSLGKRLFCAEFGCPSP